MHILEMHIIEWMSTYNAGLGLMGEQGTETISNKLYRTYGCMANKAQWLKCIVQEHHRSVCPTVLLMPIRTIKARRLELNLVKIYSWH